MDGGNDNTLSWIFQQKKKKHVFRFSLCSLNSSCLNPHFKTPNLLIWVYLHLNYGKYRKIGIFDGGHFEKWPPFWPQEKIRMPLYPKIFLRGCSSSVQKFMLVSSKAQYYQNMSHICRAITIYHSTDFLISFSYAQKI